MRPFSLLLALVSAACVVVGLVKGDALFVFVAMFMLGLALVVYFNDERAE